MMLVKHGQMGLKIILLDIITLLTWGMMIYMGVSDYYYRLTPKLNIGRVSRINKRTEYIYFYQHRNKYKHLVKIGKTRQTVKRRVADQITSAPDGLIVIGVIPVKNCTKAEGIIHSAFKDYHYNREWFYLKPRLKAYIRANRSMALTMEANP